MPDGTPTALPSTLDLREVVRQWQVIRSLAQTAESASREHVRSASSLITARRLDESQPAGHRGYIAAWSAITNGLEHIDALRILMHEHVTPRAPWTLLRSVFESGFWSCWLLDPDDGPTRRRRGLHLEVQAHKQRVAFYGTWLRYDPAGLALVTADFPKHVATYQREAAALGVPWAQVNQKIDVVRELERLYFMRTMDPELCAMMAGVWRSLSGMQHGYPYALMVNSDVDAGSSRTILGGQEVRVTIKDDAFYGSAYTANRMLVQGLSSYIARCTKP